MLGLASPGCDSSEHASPVVIEEAEPPDAQRLPDLYSAEDEAVAIQKKKVATALVEKEASAGEVIDSLGQPTTVIVDPRTGNQLLEYRYVPEGKMLSRILRLVGFAVEIKDDRAIRVNERSGQGV